MRLIVDTNVLIDGLDFKKYEAVVIPIVCLEELDKLKMNKDFMLSFKARQAIRSIYEATNKKIMISASRSLPLHLNEKLFDNEILRFVIEAIELKDVDAYYTKDINFRLKAESVGIPIWEEESTKCSIYTGYRESTMEDAQLASHYGDSSNSMELLTNEYLIVKNTIGDVVDRQKWNGKGYIHVPVKSIGNKRRGQVDSLEQLKPMDAYQACAIDSMNSNDFTILTGRAGSGKTLLAISWLINAVDCGKISKIVIVHNAVPLKNTQSLGFLPGTRNEKILGSQLGGILASKLGDMPTVIQWITQGKIELIPACDIRGVEIRSSEAIFVTEGQNMDAYTLKTVIQRAKEGAKIIVEGDILEQQDIRNCDFEDSGIYRAIEVFKGTPFFGCVQLRNGYRSPITVIADKM